MEFLYVEDGELRLPHSHCYYAQVQGKLAINKQGTV